MQVNKHSRNAQGGRKTGAHTKKRLKALRLNRNNSMIPLERIGRGEWIWTTDLLVPNLIWTFWAHPRLHYY
jgi:hypothetical protein